MLADDLHRFFEVLPDEEGAQNRVSLDDLLPCLLKHAGIEIPTELTVPLLEIDPRFRRQERMEEHPLLHRRKRIKGFYILRAHLRFRF